MLAEKPDGILDYNKKYKNPHTGEIKTGKQWIKLFERARYEIFYKDDFMSLEEVVN